MKKYGLIGYPLSHTFSPTYFSNKFAQENINDHEYKAYPIASIHGVDRLMDMGLSGLNVTIPYKEKVIPYLDQMSEDAKAIGAVNTIKIVEGKKMGFNTDAYGFENSLKPLLKEGTSYKALVLGTGGAAKAVTYVLNQLNIAFQYVSRQKEYLQYKDLDQRLIEDHKIIINTTPLGMAPKIKQKPNLPYAHLSDQHILFDLIYNPEKTLFLKLGEAEGATVKNGYEMLVLQAERSWQIWNDPNC